MSSTLTPESLVHQLNWRYATKKFDASRKIPGGEWKALEQALVLSPSSTGLQPWKFIVVNDPKVREKLKPVAWNQSQITDASHLVVFAYNKRLTPADADKYMARVAQVRGVPIESLDGLKGMVLGLINRPAEAVHNWAARQAYIALGVFLSSAAVLGIDACPMEGFDPAKFDEILGLDALGYASVVVATAGYRAADDHYAELKKVRFETKDVVMNVG